MENSQSSIYITPKQWAYLSHLSGIFYFIPFGPFLIPLIIYNILKPDQEFPLKHAKAAAQFQLACLISYVVGVIIIAISSFIIKISSNNFSLSLFYIFLFIGVALSIVPMFIGIVYMIINLIRVRDTKDPNYPFQIQFLK